MDAFPIFWSVKKKVIVLFGGGAEAAAKLRLLTKTSATVHVIADAFERDVIDLDGAVVHTGDPLAAPLPDGVAFAYAATGDAALDAALEGIGGTGVVEGHPVAIRIEEV